MAIDREILAQSYEALKPVLHHVVDQFFTFLFESFPDSKVFLAPDKRPQQKRAMVVSLVEVFENIQTPGHFEDYMREQGARFAERGLRPNHFEWIAASMLRTLKYFFGDTWSQRLEGAWMGALKLIQDGGTTFSASQEVASIVPTAQQRTANMAAEIRAKVENLMRGMMQDALTRLVSDEALKSLVREKADQVIQQALEQSLQSLAVHTQGEQKKKDAA